MLPRWRQNPPQFGINIWMQAGVFWPFVWGGGRHSECPDTGFPERDRHDLAFRERNGDGPRVDWILEFIDDHIDHFGEEATQRDPLVCGETAHRSTPLYSMPRNFARARRSGLWIFRSRLILVRSTVSSTRS